MVRITKPEVLYGLRTNITHHARERWLERVVDPKRYAHLSSCRDGCPTCISLINDIQDVVRTMTRKLDGNIYRAWKTAVEQGNYVTNSLFIQTVKKAYGKHADTLEFPIYNSGRERVVFVTAIRPDRFNPTENVRLLLTVMTIGMLEGQVIQQTAKEDMGTVFDRWKFEARQRGQDKKGV